MASEEDWQAKEDWPGAWRSSPAAAARSAARSPDCSDARALKSRLRTSNRTRRRALARSIVDAGGRARGFGADVADEASAKNAVARTIEAFGKLTTLVNVAATTTPDGTVETLSLEQWNKAIAVNLTGAFLMCKFAVPELRRSGGGSIINIASQLGHLGVPARAPYCTTKAALIHFTRILAMDHAADNIRANTISPGFILTERSSARVGGKEQRARRQRTATSAQPAGRARGNRRRCALSCR